MAEASKPSTLREAVDYFSDPDRCLRYAAALRWPEGVSCPTCHAKDLSFLATRRLWKCKTDHPRRQFSVKVGTIFEDSPIELEKWFAAIWMLANRADGVSSRDLARELDVSQKTAWFMLRRIELALRTGSFEKPAEQGSAAATIVIPFRDPRDAFADLEIGSR